MLNCNGRCSFFRRKNVLSCRSQLVQGIKLLFGDNAADNCALDTTLLPNIMLAELYLEKSVFWSDSGEMIWNSSLLSKIGETRVEGLARSAGPNAFKKHPDWAGPGSSQKSPGRTGTNFWVRWTACDTAYGLAVSWQRDHLAESDDKFILPHLYEPPQVP